MSNVYRSISCKLLAHIWLSTRSHFGSLDLKSLGRHSVSPPHELSNPIQMSLKCQKCSPQFDLLTMEIHLRGFRSRCWGAFRNQLSIADADEPLNVETNLRLNCQYDGDLDWDPQTPRHPLAPPDPKMDMKSAANCQKLLDWYWCVCGFIFNSLGWPNQLAKCVGSESGVNAFRFDFQTFCYFGLWEGMWLGILRDSLLNNLRIH